MCALEKKEPSRRDFISKATGFLIGGCLVSTVAASVRFVYPNFKSDRATQLPLGKLSDFKIRTLTWIREADLFVAHDDDGYGAFSARCTHLGCVVQRTAEGFVCPCHGAEFDQKGQVTSGPARKPLPWYFVWLDKRGRLWVDKDRQVEAKTISSTQLKRKMADRLQKADG
jgi:Rieske Fe-S protein